MTRPLPNHPQRPDSGASSPAAPSRLMPLALGGAILLVIAGGALFWRATQIAPGPERGAVHKVVVGPSSCDPANLTIPAGLTTFQIENASDRTLEWEILDGVMVLEERENIVPGLVATVTARLKPGTYAITCGLLSNPRGTLEVTPSAASDAARAAPPVTAFIGPLSEEKVYQAVQIATLQQAAGQLEAAIKAGDTAAARAAWAEARLPWKRIEGVAVRFADLASAITPQPDYLAGREADPGFTGFHRIEYGLWPQDGAAAGSTAGLEPVAARLLADVATLKDRLRAAKPDPADIAANAARQAQRLADGQITAGEDRRAGLDLPEIAAGLDGIAKSIGLMQPLVAEADPALAQRLTQTLAAARSETEALEASSGGGADAPSYAAVPEAGRKKLADTFRALAAAAGEINPALGME